MSASPLADQHACLLERLRRLPPERPLLRMAEQTLNAAEVIARAQMWRERHPEAAESIGVVRHPDPVEFIVRLVAGDGFCSHLLLLPGDFSEEKTRAVVAQRAKLPAVPHATPWVLATSGTTGEPKIVGHRRESLIRSLKADVDRGRDYCWGLAYDPARFAGLQVVLQALLAGSTLVPAALQDFSALVAAFIETPINALSATPTLWRKLLLDGRITGCPLRQITLGGEIVDQKLLDQLKKDFPQARIVHIYASTEVGVGFSVTDGLAGFPCAYIRRSVGGVALRIGQNGNLWLRPPLSAENGSGAATDGDGFFDSRDRVEVRGSRIVFLGRDNGIINVGGNKVHPEEVEAILRDHHAVREVRVTAKASPVTGELVIAEVTAISEVEEAVLRRELQAHCRARLAPYKVPALIRFVDEIPGTSAGKLCRDKEKS